MGMLQFHERFSLFWKMLSDSNAEWPAGIGVAKNEVAQLECIVYWRARHILHVRRGFFALPRHAPGTSADQTAAAPSAAFLFGCGTSPRPHPRVASSAPGRIVETRLFVLDSTMPGMSTSWEAGFCTSLSA